MGFVSGKASLRGVQAENASHAVILTDYRDFASAIKRGCASIYRSVFHVADDRVFVKNHLLVRSLAAQSIGRALSLWIGFFGLLNMLMRWRLSTFDGNLLWVDLRALPSFIAGAGLTVACLSMVAWGVRPRMNRRRQMLTLMSMAFLLVATVCNAVHCVSLGMGGLVELSSLLPFSAVVATLLGFILWTAMMSSQFRQAMKDAHADTDGKFRSFPIGRMLLVHGTVVAVFVIGFPLAQMVWFGGSDYRRQADAAVVFGARAYADGRLSTALEDRVRTACELYEAGLVRTLIFSGGPGDGDIYEAEAMQSFAVARGIPIEATRLDLAGVNTRATVENTVPLFIADDIRSVLAVSHDYHLPRIKMAYQQHGIETFTVPAKQRYRLRAGPIYMAREVAAWWWYYIEPILG